MKLPILFFVCLSLLIQASATAATGDEEIAVKAFLSQFLKRPLSDNEWRQIVAEDDGKPSPDPEEQLNMVQQATVVMRDQAGSPRDLHIRHTVVQNIVLGGAAQSTIGRLLLEVDPVVAVDKQAGRLVTRADLQALIRIFHFGQTALIPSEIGPATSQELKQATSAMKQKLDQGGRIPELASGAAALWRGMEQQWTRLDSNDRSSLRAFIRQSFKQPQDKLPDYLRLNLAGWSEAEIDQAKMASSINMRLWLHALGVAGVVQNPATHKQSIGNM
ncbi:MAG: hypothetical protein ABW098_15310 [Candidatus Thiodiazotropha sp.]